MALPASPASQIMPAPIAALPNTPIASPPVVSENQTVEAWLGDVTHRAASLRHVLMWLNCGRDLEELPVLTWNRTSYNPLDRSIKFFPPDAMASPMMQLKESGRTVAVAVKYFNPVFSEDYSSFPAVVIKIISLVDRFDILTCMQPFNVGSRRPKWLPEGSRFIFQVQTHLDCIEGRILEEELMGSRVSKSLPCDQKFEKWCRRSVHTTT